MILDMNKRGGIGTVVGILFVVIVLFVLAASLLRPGGGLLQRAFGQVGELLGLGEECKSVPEYEQELRTLLRPGSNANTLKEVHEKYKECYPSVQLPFERISDDVGSVIRWDVPSNRIVAGFPTAVSAVFPGLPNGWDEVDAVTYWPPGGGNNVGGTQGVLFFFKGNEYIKWSIADNGMISGYPLPISRWSGLPPDFQQGLDAATYWPPDGFGGQQGVIVFFKGNQYVQWSVEHDQFADAELISTGFPGLPQNFKQGIDAAAYWPQYNGIYLFKDGQYILWDTSTDSISTRGGQFPRQTATGWPGIWDGQDIDAATYWDGDETYFFKK